MCCSAGVDNSENVVDKTTDSSCHSRLLRRKQEAYLSLSAKYTQQMLRCSQTYTTTKNVTQKWECVRLTNNVTSTYQGISFSASSPATWKHSQQS